jgi:3-dehydroquinate dehydratase
LIFLFFLFHISTEKLSEANERVDALAQKLEQSEAARKKAELAASKAKAEVDEAKVKAASIEELQRRLKDAESALDEQKTAQTVREQEIIKRLKSQSRRTLSNVINPFYFTALPVSWLLTDVLSRVAAQTNQDFDLDNPVNDPLLDALSLLEFHGRAIREGVANANAGLSALFPYFFPKKEEPATFLNLAKMFNASEDLGLKMRQENMKVAVESTVALVADSQQTLDWMKVGDTSQIEHSRWRSLIKAAKPNTKKILAYLGIKPASTPSSSRPEV